MKLTTNIETPGSRLKSVIALYFISQKEFAKLVEIDTASLSNYISGKYKLTKKLAEKLEKKAGIRSDYILNGNEPIMGNENLKPILKEGNMPHMSKINIKTQFGLTKQYALKDEGRKETLRDIGEVSVVNLILGDLEEKPIPFMVLQTSISFAERYDILSGSVLVLKKKYMDDDLVLFTDQRKYRLGFLNKDQIIEKSTEETYKTNNVEVIGNVVLEIRTIRY